MKQNIFLIDSFSLGGAENQLVALKNAGIINRMYIVSIEKNSFQTDKILDFVNVIYLFNFKFRNNLIRLLLIPIIIFRLVNVTKNISKNKNINLISFLVFSNFINIISSFFINKNTIVSQRTSLCRLKDRYRILYFLTKILFPFSDKIVVPSNGIKNEFSKLGYPSKKVHLIYNISDFEKFNFQDFNLNKENKPYLLIVSRFIYEKRIIDFLKIYKNLKMYKKYNLKIIGDGPMKELLKHEFSDSVLNENVEFLIVKERINLFQYYYEASYTINFSIYEGFPNILLESLLSGTPIISCNSYHGVADLFGIDFEINTIIESQIGFLFPNDLSHSDKIFNMLMMNNFNFDKIQLRNYALNKFNSHSVCLNWENLLNNQSYYS